MTEMNEQLEQEMIERAKAGDPEANYKMSLWALDQAMAEPDELRWNRLAAKCLVKAAEAGYAPAKAKMDELLQAAEAKNGAHVAPERPQQTVTPAESESTAAQLNKAAEQAGAAAIKAGKAAGKAAAKAGAAIASGASTLAKKAKDSRAKAAQAAQAKAEDSEEDIFAEEGSEENAPAGGRSGGSHTSKKSILPDFSKWDDAKWKKMQIACIVICVILAVLIAVLIITGNKKDRNAENPEETPLIPAADVADTPAPAAETETPANAAAENAGAENTADTPAPAEETIAPENVTQVTTAPAPAAEEQEPYPPQDILDAIRSAGLAVNPDEADYVTEERTVTVTTSGSALNMRNGPSTNNTVVGAIPNGTQVPLYANKNGWSLVNYEGIWGWCSYDFLR